MTAEADFCGDRLRLASFLRVVGNAPQRPLRFRRRIKQDERVDAVPSPQPGQPEVAGMESPAATPNPTRNDLTPVGKEALRDNAQTSEKPRKVNTRKKHRLPAVNGLALVRTTSEFGLPSPGLTDPSFSYSIVDGDPIEDIQLYHAAPKSKHLRRKHAPRNGKTPMIVIPRRWIRSKSPITRNVPGQKPVYSVQTVLTSTRRKILPKSTLATISDGFVGAELVPPKTETEKRANKRIHTSKKKLISIPSAGGLILADGLLPDPSVGVDGTTNNAPVISFMQDIGSLPARPSQHLDRNVTRPPRSTVDVPSHDEHAVVTQLSCVTAPIRDDSASESSGSDEEQEECEDDAGNESEGSAASSHCGEFAATPLNTTYPLEESTYFSEAMCGLRYGDEGELFWNQYGHLD